MEGNYARLHSMIRAVLKKFVHCAEFRLALGLSSSAPQAKIAAKPKLIFIY